MRMIRRSWQAAILAVTGPIAALGGLVALLAGGLLVPAVAIPAVASWHRGRYAGIAGEHLTRPARGRDLISQLAFCLLVVPLSAVSFTVVVTLLAVSAAGFGWLTFGWSVPFRSSDMLHYGDPFSMSVVPVAATLAVVAGLAAARLSMSLELAVARTMLQPSRAELLAERVDTLTESRADIVDAADAERRRIERDLHDGAQQRLVSLAMNLGLARATLTDADPRVRQALADAHDEAKVALTELRDLVRGLHPAVLDDRGLDAALSGIAARSPVPVQLTVRVEARPSRTIEAVAYFVVAEALANVAKHAHARQARVDVTRTGSTLTLVIRDDGRGGADPAGGTGLRGLAQRAGSVDGTVHVTSPVGGPTVITVELPCES